MSKKFLNLFLFLCILIAPTLAFSSNKDKGQKKQNSQEKKEKKTDKNT